MKAHNGTVRVEQDDLPADLATAFGEVDRIAWDVETTGLDWRRERLATCQLFAEGIGVVVVRTADGCPERLAALLEDPAVEKVFHHAPFDLRFMVHAWNVRPTSIRCTKVASKLLTPDAPNESHSLQQLVARNLARVSDIPWLALMFSQMDA
jgi:ribonuclease D